MADGARPGDLRIDSQEESASGRGSRYSGAVLGRTKAARELSRAAVGMNCRVSGSAHQCAGRGQVPIIVVENGACPRRQLQKRATFRIYQLSTVARLGIGSCDRCHKLSSDYPLFFWTPTDRCVAVRCRAAIHRPPRKNDNPQDGAVVQKMLSTLTQRWLAVS
jgi:hypothetical protein